MSRHADWVVLHQMRDHAQEALVMAAGASLENLASNRMMLLALTRFVEIVGESANRVSQAGQSAFPSIPWKQIIGMRNRLIHGYDKVDVEIL